MGCRVPSSGLLLLAACGGPEAKKAKFLERGKEYSRQEGLRPGRAGIQERDPDRPEVRGGVPPAGVVPTLPGRPPRRLRQPVESDGAGPEAAAGAVPAREIAADRGRAWEGDGEGRARPQERPGRRGRAAPERGGPGGREGDREGPRVSRRARGEGDRPPDVYLLLARVYMQEKDSRSAEAVLLQGIEGNGKDVASPPGAGRPVRRRRQVRRGGGAGEGSDRAPAGHVRQFHHPGGVVLEHEAGAERQGGAERSGRGQAAGRGPPAGRGPLLPVPGGGRRRGEAAAGGDPAERQDVPSALRPGRRVQEQRAGPSRRWRS